MFLTSLLNHRSTLERLAEYGRKQQEELLQRQAQLQQVHDNLIENSKSILEAQVCDSIESLLSMVLLSMVFCCNTETTNLNTFYTLQEAFESKQATMFIALDRLFALHNAMLLESRIIKSFFIYTMSIFIIYMFTSTKQTYNVRARLYMGKLSNLNLVLKIQI